MADSMADRHSRRHALALGLGGLGGVALGAALALAPDRARAYHAVQGAGGIAGGGVVTADQGEVEFLLFGSRFEFEDHPDPVFFGELRLRFADGTTLASTGITAYGPVEGAEETTREMTGTLSVNGDGSHPFRLTAVDQGWLGAGEDRLTLSVDLGDASPVAGSVDFEDAAVTTGDLHLLTFTFPDA